MAVEFGGLRVEGSGLAVSPRVAAGLAPRGRGRGPLRPPVLLPLPLSLLLVLAATSPAPLVGDAARALAAEPWRQIDEAAAAAAGVRTLVGKHLLLLTDLAPKAEVDALPAMFDQAYPQWCAYFGVDPVQHAAWRVRGFVIQDKPLFRRLGLLPEGLPPFPDGFAAGREFWVYEQASDYYRAHLVLHEGTHAFMANLLGGFGPIWYMEGMAELLATHRWKDGKLVLNHFPASREEVPLWGRIKIIKDHLAARRGKTFKAVLQTRPEAQQVTEAYAWYWAAAALLDRHPRYQPRFRQMARLVTAPDFTERFQRSIGDDWDHLAEEWKVFVADLEYGYDVPKTAIDFTPGKPLAAAGATVTLAADRGWQNSGVRLEAGQTYRLRATGRYQVANRPPIWWCEPGGVSIRYYRGRPLGILLAAVWPDPPSPTGISPLIAPITVGLGTTLAPKQAGTLLLRINDSAGELGDNAGTLAVEVRREGESEE